MGQIKRGLLELCILNLLHREGMYGYQIVKRLTSVPGLVITEGTIYPLLSRLKSEGHIVSRLVESSQGPARRVYQLSSDGRAYLERINAAWSEIAGAVQNVIEGKHTEQGAPDHETEEF
ncbi:MAG: PadR family transcriptional regulator [Planctomycetes bacterium]|nr:PadR family transcriptional regulator [Planctomycetota bacterium]